MYSGFPFQVHDAIAYLTDNYSKYLRLVQIVEKIKTSQLALLEKKLESLYPEEFPQEVNIFAEDLCYSDYFANELLLINPETKDSNWFRDNQTLSIDDLKLLTDSRLIHEKKWCLLGHQIIRLQAIEILTFYFSWVTKKRNKAEEFDFKLNAKQSKLCARYSSRSLRALFEISDEDEACEKITEKNDEMIHPEKVDLLTFALQQRKLRIAEHLIWGDFALTDIKTWHVALEQLDPILDFHLIKKLFENANVSQSKLIKEVINHNHLYVLHRLLPSLELRERIPELIIHCIAKENVPAFILLLATQINSLVNANHSSEEINEAFKPYDIPTQFLDECPYMVQQLFLSEKTHNRSFFKELRLLLLTKLDNKYGISLHDQFNEEDNHCADIALQGSLSTSEVHGYRKYLGYISHVSELRNIIMHGFIHNATNCRLMQYHFSSKDVEIDEYILKHIDEDFSDNLDRFIKSPLEFILQESTLIGFAHQLRIIRSYYEHEIDFKKTLKQFISQGKAIKCLILCRHLRSIGEISREEMDDAINKAALNESSKNSNDELLIDKLGFRIYEQSHQTMEQLNTDLIAGGPLNSLEQVAIQMLMDEQIPIRLYHATKFAEEIQKRECFSTAKELLLTGEIEKTSTPEILRSNVFFSIGSERIEVTNFLRDNYDVVQLDIREAIRKKIINANEIWTSMHFSALPANRVYYPIIFLSPCRQYGTIYRITHIGDEKKFLGYKCHQFFYVALRPTIQVLEKKEIEVPHNLDIVQGDPTEFIAKKLVWFMRHLQSPRLPSHYGNYLTQLYASNNKAYKLEIQNLINCFFTPYNFETKIAQSFQFDLKQVKDLENPYFLRFIENPFAVTTEYELDIADLEKSLKSSDKQDFIDLYQNQLISSSNNHSLVLMAIDTCEYERVCWLLDLGIDIHNHSETYIIHAAQRLLFATFYNENDKVHAKNIFKALLLYGTTQRDVHSPFIRALANPANTTKLIENLIMLTVLIRDLDLCHLVMKIGDRNDRYWGYLLELEPSELTDKDDVALINSIRNASNHDLLETILKLNIDSTTFGLNTAEKKEKILLELIKATFIQDNVAAMHALTFNQTISIYDHISAFLFNALHFRKVRLAAYFLSRLNSADNMKETLLSPDGHLWALCLYSSGLLEEESILDALLILKNIQGTWISLEFIAAFHASDHKLVHKLLSTNPANTILQLKNLIKHGRRLSVKRVHNLFLLLDKVYLEVLPQPVEDQLISFANDIWLTHFDLIQELSSLGCTSEFLSQLIIELLTADLSKKQQQVIAQFLYLDWMSCVTPHELLSTKKGAEIFIEIVKHVALCDFDGLSKSLLRKSDLDLLSCLIALTFNLSIPPDCHHEAPLFLFEYYLQTNKKLKVVRLLQLFMRGQTQPSPEFHPWLSSYQALNIGLLEPWLNSETLIDAIAIAVITTNDLFYVLNVMGASYHFVGKCLDQIANFSMTCFTDEFFAMTPPRLLVFVTHPKLRQLFFFHYQQSILHFTTESIIEGNLQLESATLLELYKIAHHSAHVLLPAEQNLKRLFQALFTKNILSFTQTYQALAYVHNMKELTQSVIIDFPYALAMLESCVTQRMPEHIIQGDIQTLLSLFFSKKIVDLLTCAVLANNEPAIQFLLNQGHFVGSHHLNSMMMALIFNRMHLAKLLFEHIDKDNTQLIAYYQKMILAKMIEPDLFSGFATLKSETLLKELCVLYCHLQSLDDSEKMAIDAIQSLLNLLNSGTKGEVLSQLKALQLICRELFELEEEQNLLFHACLSLFEDLDNESQVNSALLSSFKIEPSFREACESLAIDTSSGTGKTNRKPGLALSKTALEWDRLVEPEFTKAGIYEDDLYRSGLKRHRGLTHFEPHYPAPDDTEVADTLTLHIQK